MGCCASLTRPRPNSVTPAKPSTPHDATANGDNKVDAEAVAEIQGDEISPNTPVPKRKNPPSKKTPQSESDRDSSLPGAIPDADSKIDDHQSIKGKSKTNTNINTNSDADSDSNSHLHASLHAHDSSEGKRKSGDHGTVIERFEIPADPFEAETRDQLPSNPRAETPKSVATAPPPAVLEPVSIAEAPVLVQPPVAVMRQTTIPILGIPSIAPAINISSDLEFPESALQGDAGMEVGGSVEKDPSPRLSDRTRNGDQDPNAVGSGAGISASYSFPMISSSVQADECDLGREKQVRQFMSKVDMEFQAYQKFESDNNRAVVVLDRTKRALSRDLEIFEREDQRLAEMSLEELKSLEDGLKGALKKLSQFEQMKGDLTRNTREQGQKKASLKLGLETSLVDFQAFLQSIHDYDHQLLSKMDILESKRQSYTEMEATESVKTKLKRINGEIATGKNLHASLTDLSRYMNDVTTKIITRIRPELDRLIAADKVFWDKADDYDPFMGDARTHLNLFKAHFLDQKKRLSGAPRHVGPIITTGMPMLVVASDEETTQERSLSQMIAKLATDLNGMLVGDETTLRTMRLTARCRRALDKDVADAHTLLAPLYQDPPGLLPDPSVAKATVKAAEKRFVSLRKMVDSITKELGAKSKPKEDLKEKLQEILREIDTQREEMEVLHSAERSSLERKREEKERLQLEAKTQEESTLSEDQQRKAFELMNDVEKDMRAIEDRVQAQVQLISTAEGQEKEIKERLLPQLEESIKRIHDVEIEIEEHRMSLEKYITDLRAMKAKLKSTPATGETKTDQDFERQFNEAASSLNRIGDDFKSEGIDFLNDV
eukprot:TRINITY_DN3545_c0_g1_i1.p1 TRINITY_DN3545_c0_g1~~TRINITY_DN3545_c0_g1_i1.p1  ORF type:complete len:833 (-),score=221.06 TRINITY_DN3545_c0_g1_i1:419-2917(-)